MPKLALLFYRPSGTACFWMVVFMLVLFFGVGLLPKPWTGSKITVMIQQALVANKESAIPQTRTEAKKIGREAF
jgi:hypothetical protein